MSEIHDHLPASDSQALTKLDRVAKGDWGGKGDKGGVVKREKVRKEKARVKRAKAKAMPSR